MESGQISGSVTDQTGRAVPNALVSAVAKRTGEMRKSTVSGSGDWAIPELMPGDYTLAVTAPGFESAAASVTVAVGQHVRTVFTLRSAVTKRLNTESQTQERLISDSELRDLPNLTRDPYRFAELTGNASDAGLGTRGVGLAVNGQRESSTNILVDGIDNKDEFTGSVGQPFPLDSIYEFAILTSDFTAEYGRASGAIVNAAGQRGGNAFHGSAYEFNRVSALTASSFLANANGTPQMGFQSNQFGAAVSGPVFRNRLFFFANTEGTLVRSEATVYAWVPTSQLLAQTTPNTQAFFQTLGQLRPGAQVLGTISIAQLTAMNGISPCTGLVCGTLPASLPLFSHEAYRAPGDAGGGFPQNTVDSYNRLDYKLSDKTRLYGRYGLYDEHDQSGGLSNSPYANYDLSQKQVDNSFLISAFHQWSPRWVSQTAVAFNRITVDQQGLTSRGVVPSMYANPFAPVNIGADPVAFPGYNPFTPGSGGTFGGPENILQFNHDLTWTAGKHVLRLGGDYIYIRDNRTDAAYQTAVDSLSNTAGLGPALGGLLSGTFAQIQVAIDPQGQFPCGQSASCSVNLPVSSPNFSRGNRFQEGALYAQDYWQFTRRIAINLGVRWEHFGVQHNSNPNLDSNWYAPGVGFADSNLLNYIARGGLRLASKSPVGGLYNPDWKDFAPRIGFAWDVFGNGRTTLRGGYGIGYDRNFGNVTFNVIQNLPNYTVLSVPGSITTNNFGPLAGSGSTVSLPAPGARIIDPDLKTAYAHFWSVSVAREISRGMTYSLDYSGSKGVDLYSVSYPNQIGFGTLPYGAPNPNYSEDVGYRGNQGFSHYYGLNNRFAVSNFLHSGVVLTASYTFSHAIDNISSTFFEAGGQGVMNRYGDRNITINNGDFDAGLLDPYQPNLDRGNAEFDIRHRVVVSGDWKVPIHNRFARPAKLFEGWSLAPLFIARSGQPFSVFDTIAQTLDLNAPRATFVEPVPTSRNTFVPSTTPDTYHIITFLPAQIAHEPFVPSPGAPWPSNMSARDAFRAPGFWNFDLAFFKDTRMTEKLALQVRAELFNVFNHANLYVIGTTANVGAGNTIDACYGCSGSSYDRRQVQLAARFSF